MTAREFLVYAGYEVTEENLWNLKEYLQSSIDYRQFPDADVFDSEGNSLSENLDEPVAFQEYMDFPVNRYTGEQLEEMYYQYKLGTNAAKEYAHIFQNAEYTEEEFESDCFDWEVFANEIGQ